jgi:hypothetical protein
VAEYLASEAEFDAGAKRDYIKKIITILMQPHVGPLVELKTYVQDCRDGFDSEASMEQEDFNGCNAEVQSILQKLGILLLLSYPKCPPRIVNQQLAASVKVPDSVAGIVAALLSIVEKLKKHFNNYMDNRTTVLNVKLIDQCVQVLQACYPALYQAFEAYVKDSSRTAVDENDCEDSDDAAAVIVATSANSATAFVANRRQPSLGSGPEHCSGSGSTKTGITSLANQ